MKLYRDGIEWEQDYFFIWWWNLLPKELRYWGFRPYYYDGPIGTFGWWWGNISWRTPWTKDKVMVNAKLQHADTPRAMVSPGPRDEERDTAGCPGGVPCGAEGQGPVGPAASNDTSSPKQHNT